jgi:hypothetical protein
LIDVEGREKRTKEWELNDVKNGQIENRRMMSIKYFSTGTVNRNSAK